MPNLLVTGRWGETHVTSAQARNFHAGVFGGGQYVLSGLTATMTTANTCHIDPGVACFNGADVEVPAGGVDVTIDNGTQGQKRNDLVVLRYTSEPSTQTESVELAVVKGTPASSDPQDPAHNEGSILEGDSPVDFPLYRVVTDGINAGDPEPLFDVLMSMADLRDSVSQATEDTGWQYLWQSGTDFVQYRRIGPLVYLWWIVPQASTVYWTCPSHLPEGCRPYGSTFLPAVLASSTGYITNNVAFAFVDVSGIVGFQAGAAVGGANNRGCGCFVALQA